MGEKAHHRTRGEVIDAGIQAGEPVSPGEVGKVAGSLPGRHADGWPPGCIHDERGRTEGWSLGIGSHGFKEWQKQQVEAPAPEKAAEITKGPTASSEMRPFSSSNDARTAAQDK